MPADAIQTVDCLDIAIKIPADVYERSRERLIDADATAFEKLTLR